MCMGIDRTQTTVRMSTVNHEWLSAVCADAHVSLNRGLEILLDEARLARVSLRAMSGQVIRP